MFYLSTRDSSLKMNSMDVIKQGISREGGLFVPERIPRLTRSDMKEMEAMDYRQRAFKVLSLFLTDYSESDLQSIVEAAYRSDNFETPEIAPIIA